MSAEGEVLLVASVQPRVRQAGAERPSRGLEGRQQAKLMRKGRREGPEHPGRSCVARSERLEGRG